MPSFAAPLGARGDDRTGGKEEAHVLGVRKGRAHPTPVLTVTLTLAITGAVPGRGLVANTLYILIGGLAHAIQHVVFQRQAEAVGARHKGRRLLPEEAAHVGEVEVVAPAVPGVVGALALRGAQQGAHLQAGVETYEL